MYNLGQHTHTNGTKVIKSWAIKLVKFDLVKREICESSLVIIKKSSKAQETPLSAKPFKTPATTPSPVTTAAAAFDDQTLC